MVGTMGNGQSIEYDRPDRIPVRYSAYWVVMSFGLLMGGDGLMIRGMHSVSVRRRDMQTTGHPLGDLVDLPHKLPHRDAVWKSGRSWVQVNETATVDKERLAI